MTALDEITINGTANTGSRLLGADGGVMPTATAASEIERADAPLPEWMSEPCPPWCRSGVHSNRTPYCARLHMSGSCTVWLYLEDPHINPVEEWEEFGDASPAPIDVIMCQHYRDRDPYLIVTLDCQGEPRLTTGEAAELAAALASLAASAGDVADETPSGSPYWLSRPCPAWCTASHSDADAPRDRAHVGEWRQVILTMEGPDPDGRPEHIGVRLEQGYREAEARVVIAYSSQRLNLALAGARELSDDMDGLLADAR